jgi:hypothetical protein
MMDFSTKFEFVLPKGYIDKNGILHKDGVMRLATGADEILPLKDPRVQSNSAYHVFILLSRVIESIGSIKNITPQTIEELFTADLAYLQEFYNRINSTESRLLTINCPHCNGSFEIEPESVGE